MKEPKPGSKVFFATVHLAIIADTVEEATDEISAGLSENWAFSDNGQLLDWQYDRQDGKYAHPAESDYSLMLPYEEGTAFACTCCEKGIRDQANPSCGFEAPPGFVIVERCDACQLFSDDLKAAEAWGDMARWFHGECGHTHAIAKPRSAA